MNRIRRNFLEKLILDVLVIGGIFLMCLPFLKENIISLQLRSTNLNISMELPETIKKEEMIRIPTIRDVIENHSRSVTGYGFVSIESLQIQQPLLIGLTNEQLLKGGVVMFPERSLKEDNFVLLGHHLGRQNLLFGRLTDAQTGMKIEVEYLGQTQQYTITDIKIVKETELSVIENQQSPLLTLITCPTPTQTDERLVITAELDSIETNSNRLNEQEMQEMEYEHTHVGEQTNQKKIQIQEQMWKEQSNSNWFVFFVILLVVSGALIIIHKLVDLPK